MLIAACTARLSHTSAKAEWNRLGGALGQCVPRMAPHQLLAVAAVACRVRILPNHKTRAAGVEVWGLHAIDRLRSDPRREKQAFEAHPGRAARLAERLAESVEPHDRHGAEAAAYVVQGVAQSAESYPPTLVAGVLRALAKQGAPPVFRSLAFDHRDGLVARACEVATEEAGSQAEVAELFATLGRLGSLGTKRSGILGRHLADHIESLDAKSLSMVGLTLKGGDTSQPNDFILLHGVCRRSASEEIASELSGVDMVFLLQVCNRFDLYDEAFIDVACSRMLADAATLRGAQLAEVVNSLGFLRVEDRLDLFCEALAPRVAELREPGIVKCMRGLLKARHCHEGLLKALAPVVERQVWSFNSVSLTNIVSGFSLFDVAGVQFFETLLQAVKGRITSLSSTSVQHVLTAVSRQRSNIGEEVLYDVLEKLLSHVTKPALAQQFTPIQVLGSFSALSRLGYRDLAASSVLLCALVGRSPQVNWDWAPSAQFYAKRQLPPPPFDAQQCNRILSSGLDLSHYVEILQGIHRLELHSSLTLNLVAIIQGLLIPQFHELRARELIAGARALGACQFPESSADLFPLADRVGEVAQGDSSVSNKEVPDRMPQGQAVADVQVVGGREPRRGDTFSVDASSVPPHMELWKEQVVQVCVESLRRHEHFLETSWHTLLPLRLLCAEVDGGVFGSRNLSAVLSPTLFSFVNRLRLLSEEEADLNRARKESGEEGAAGITLAAAASHGQNIMDMQDEKPIQDHSSGHCVSVHPLLAHGISVDLLVEFHS